MPGNQRQRSGNDVARGPVMMMPDDRQKMSGNDFAGRPMGNVP